MFLLLKSGSSSMHRVVKDAPYDYYQLAARNSIINALFTFKIRAHERKVPASY
jgi:hypothetical protein